MKVLDLFAGLGGWSAPFIDHGHEVFSIDIDEQFPVSLHADIREVTAANLPWKPDVIVASPPCEGFSVMTIGRNWHYDGRPKTPKAQLAIDLVEATLRIVRETEPVFWVMENPVGKLRKLSVVAGLERRTVTYCHYGEDRMKPTDLWSDSWPPSLRLEPMCRNNDPCHVRAVRGSRTGTQSSMSYARKSLIPYPLAAAVMEACERDLDRGPAPPPYEWPGLWDGSWV